MRPLFTFFLSLVVAFSAAGGGVGLPCACGCGNVEEFCPCGHTKDNVGGGSEASVPPAPVAPIIPATSTNPVDSNCSPHESHDSPAVAPTTDNQLEPKTNAMPYTGKAFVSVYGYNYSTLQNQFALCLDLLRGPPWQSPFIKTNTRLAALSTLRI